MVALPGMYMLYVRIVEIVEYNRYSKRWHRKYGPAVHVAGRHVILSRLTPFGEKPVFIDLKTLDSGLRGNWQKRAFESFLRNTPPQLRDKLLESIAGKPAVGNRGERFWIMLPDSPFGFAYLGYDGKRWILENDLEKALFSTFGKKSIGKVLRFQKGPMRLFQLYIEDQSVGYLAEMESFGAVADNPEKALAELVQRAAQHLQKESTSGLEL